MTGGPLGPFEISGDALLAVRPGDGSFVSRESRSDLLTQRLRAAGVDLGGRDQVVLGWLAGQDVQAVAAVAGSVARSAPPCAVFTAGQEAVVARALADAENLSPQARRDLVRRLHDRARRGLR
jgi:GGDEF-like domain